MIHRKACDGVSADTASSEVTCPEANVDPQYLECAAVNQDA